MKFAYVASLLLAVVPLSFASPGVTRRDADNSDIIGVLQTFKASTQIILPQITALAQTGNSTAVDVHPLMVDLTNAASTASASLKEIQAANSTARAQDPAVANLMSSILTDITNTLNNASSTLSIQAADITALDDVLSVILMLLEGLVMGTLVLVAFSVVGVSVLLLTLGLGLVLAALGL